MLRLTVLLLMTARSHSFHAPKIVANSGNVAYVEQFPQTFSINNAEEVNTDIIGILDFSIYDSLLILSARDNKGLWSFLSLPDCHFLGKFLTQGQGPYEFFHCPWVSQNTLFKEEGTLYAGIYDFATGAVWDNNQKNTPPHLEKLNAARIIEGDDHNILSTGIQYNAVIEMPLELNYINMYSIDGTFGKTFSTT